jgi:hypothetical protein
MTLLVCAAVPILTDAVRMDEQVCEASARGAVLWIPDVKMRHPPEERSCGSLMKKCLFCCDFLLSENFRVQLREQLPLS